MAREWGPDSKQSITRDEVRTGPTNRSSSRPIPAGSSRSRVQRHLRGTGTRVTESYAVTKELTIIGWFIIDTLYGCKDRRSDLHVGMEHTLDRLAEITESKSAVS
jgi:hypothetical protein